MPTILIVDDEKANVFLLTEILKLYNYKVISAHDGGEALEKISSQRPDMVLLDIMMPVMDGMEVLEKVRNNNEIKNTPIIMISARNEPEDISNALNKGADDYITKPVTSSKIMGRIKTVENRYSANLQ